MTVENNMLDTNFLFNLRELKSMLCAYSRVPNNRPSPLINFEKFPNPPLLFQPPPFINFWKKEMMIDIIFV